jgi:rhamnosyl/mannosyltransferase
MNIVHIYKDYYPVLGGMENHIRQIAEAFVKRGHNVSVLVTNTQKKLVMEELNGVRVVKASRDIYLQSTPISFQFPYIVAHLTKRADIVHLHAPYPIGEMCNLWFGKGKKTVITWQSDVVKQKTLLRFYSPVLRRVLKKVDHIILSSEIYGRTSAWVSPYLAKSTAIPLGISPQRFFAPNKSNEDVSAYRRQLNVPPNTFLLLSVGRLRYYKGLDDLIRALPNLPADILAVIVGIGPMEAEWRALADQLGVADRIIWAGEVDDAELATYYHCADVYVIPANVRAEAYGIAIVEAMMSGLPVISTEVGTATSWLNLHEQTGLVVAPHAPDQIADAVLRLYENAVLRQNYACAAQKRAIGEFTEDIMFDRLEALYGRVLNGM